MIVKYARERGYKGGDKDPYLTLGASYTVVGLSYAPFQNVCELIIGDEDNDEGPGVWDARFFDFIDGRIPDGWVVTQFDNRSVWLSPKEFLGDFWELYHEGDEEAERIFAEVLDKIKAFHAKTPIELG